MPEKIDADVVVVGAGPAGLSAAAEAARNGKVTLLIDSAAAPGGQIWRSDRGEPHSLAVFFFEAARRQGVEWHPETTIFDAGPNWLLAQSPEGVLKIRTEAVILATGASELFLPFPGWTLPGVFGVGGIQALAKTGLDVKDKRIVVAGSGPLLVAVASSLRKKGAKLAGLYEQTSREGVKRFALAAAKKRGGLTQIARYASAAVHLKTGWWPVRAIGSTKIEAVELTNGKRTKTIPCDYLACSFGLVPNDILSKLLSGPDGSKLVFDPSKNAHAWRVYLAGETVGIGGVDVATEEGIIAGRTVAGSEVPQWLKNSQAKHQAFRELLAECYALRPEVKALAQPDTIVCRCEDVTFGQLQSQASFPDAKLQTRCGMGPCQGRICRPITRTICNWVPTMENPPRPPITPVSIQTMIDAYQEED